MHIAVLLSGGVDSSLALAKAVEAYGRSNVTAFYLKIWLEDELAYLGSCPWEEDLQFAQKTCAMFGVPLEVIALQQEYHERVVSYVVRELRQGRTPSPDIFCNKYIKFGAFFEVAGKSFARIITGHYAQVLRNNEGAFLSLHKGLDPIKDQTYFLAQMTAEQIARCDFPVGGMSKTAVRSEAENLNLPARARKDSQGICFLGKIKYEDFVRHHLGIKKGPIVELSSGKVLGEHEGFWFFTYGQRKGLRLHGGPWFVAEKDVTNNTVYVKHETEVLQHQKDRFRIEDIQEIVPFVHRPPEQLTLKVRHGARVYRADLQENIVQLEEQDPGLATGQFAVFYHHTECLGSGKIILNS